MEAYDRLVQLVSEVADDVAKCEGGNKAAGTRVRKAMQSVKAAAQDVRKDVLSMRSDDGEGGGGGGGGEAVGGGW